VLSDPFDDPKSTPEIGVLLIPLPPGVSTTTGIPDALEAAGPGPIPGDGNGDNIQDNRQNNVASLPDATDNSYVTLTTVDPFIAGSQGNTILAGVTALTNPSPSDAPANVNFPLGLFNFSVVGLTPGASTTVRMLLPLGTTVTDFWRYGP